MKFIDSFLNKITMYKLTLYYLLAIIGYAVFLGFTGTFFFNPINILLSATLSLFSCLIFNFIFSKFFRAITNSESAIITALILTLLLPTLFPLNVPFILLASFLAMGSKYLAVIEKHHIFNPAAVSVAAISLLSPEHTAVWWVGTSHLMPVVLIGGLLLIRKIQREKMVFSFFVTYFIILAILGIFKDGSLFAVFNLWERSILSSSVLFLGFVMLTEPITSPSTSKKQIYYAILVAILFTTPEVGFFNFVLIPELALCVGNLFSYIISPFYRFELTLKEKRKVATDTYEFAFERPNFSFLPGQYMEWTLPHGNIDSRGNRRYFSLSSSPTEDELSMSIRFYSPPSSFKRKLLGFINGSKIVATQLAGDFIMPKDLSKPLVFIGGGIGIAPFKSMIKYIIDKNIKVNIIIIYANRHDDDIAFKELFDKAKQYGVKTIYILTDKNKIPLNWEGQSGYITIDFIKKEIPDFDKRLFYLSGPQIMIENFVLILKKLGLKNSQIISDFFPGYSENK